MYIRLSNKNGKIPLTRLKTRYVPHAKDPGKDNIIIIARKHTMPAKDKLLTILYREDTTA